MELVLMVSSVGVDDDEAFLKLLVVVEDHGALVCALEGLVTWATTCEALDGTCLDGLIGWSR